MSPIENLRKARNIKAIEPVGRHCYLSNAIAFDVCVLYDATCTKAVGV